ncbi:sulfite oxidase [Rhodococcus sp. OK611]|uniref:molybdopterin-dependent oxidoreductase n=1 Tax=unclassified Rhodococcus (in: high G+C Gram-positive bacteria) TaxID=192944 RepID=UPI000BC3762A|nr:sulfite oxidase [Rhodococcus sp. OK611]SNX93403.1 sulfite oxidase [Rhodococcus sp. OK270]
MPETSSTSTEGSPVARNAALRLIARAVSGVIAAGVVLGVGELLSALTGPESSPLFAVGSTTVDRSPAWAREFAITTFGTNDKPALFIGMSVLVAVIAAIAGIVERPSRPYGSAILAGLGLVGMYAAYNRPGASGADAVPTVVGVILGIVVLRLLTAQLDEPSRGSEGGMGRRRFLVIASVAVAVAAAAGVAGRQMNQRLSGVLESRRRVKVPVVVDRAAPIPPGVDLEIPGATSFITPNPVFYRIDTALQVPRLTTEDWRLRIHGMVDREVTLGWDELLRRTPIERRITLTCVSNEVGGELAGNATWVGFPIAELLDEVGVQRDADMLLSKSVDGFTVGTPVEVLRDGRDALLAIAMNGEPLPLEHGFPVRQVVPGLYGFVSATKWVVDWELTRFDRAQAYWTKRGWGDRAPIKTASRIDVPAAFAPVSEGQVTIAGTAWAQHRGIERVEVRVDEGPWQPATLAPQYSIDTWRQWSWQWDAPAGVHNVQVRATDLDGNVQTEERAEPIPDGATGWHSRTITVR